MSAPDAPGAQRPEQPAAVAVADVTTDEVVQVGRLSVASAQEAAGAALAACELAPRAVGDGATVADLPGTLFLPGAVPVRIDGATIAGIGVGGAPDGMADEACAAAGLEALTGPAEG